MSKKEGDICGLEGCQGVVGFPPVQGCSCHISPPCSACTDQPPSCLICGQEYGDDE